MTTEPRIEIKDPLLIVYRQEGDEDVIFRLHQPPDYDIGHYGIIICDIVRHVAQSYGVPEKDVWAWVDRERRKPTGKVYPAH